MRGVLTHRVKREAFPSSLRLGLTKVRGLQAATQPGFDSNQLLCTDGGGWVVPPVAGSRLQGYLSHKNPPPLGPYRRPMPRVLSGSYGVGRLPMSEVPLYAPAEAVGA